MLIIMFHTRPGMAKGNSRRQNRCQEEKRKALVCLIEVARHGSQGLVKAESHIPGLAGENGEDQRQFRPHDTVRKQKQKKRDGKREIAKHWNRLQDVQQGDAGLTQRAALRRRMFRRST